MSQPVGDRPRILVVDDEQVIRDMLADFLAMEGYAVETAEDGVAAVARLEHGPVDLVLSDLKMPRMGGIALIDEIARAAPHAVTVIMTGFGTVETAIDAMKRGAYDYVLKPFKLDEVVHVVRRGLDKQRMTTENMRLREALSLYKVSEAIQASLSLDQVLETVVDTCRDELHADAVWTWLDDGEGGFFERQHLRGASLPEGVSTGRLAPEVVVEHLRTEPLLLEQGEGGGRFFTEAPGAPVTSIVAVPLRIQQRGASGTGPRLLGFLAAASLTRGKRFDEGQRKLLSIVSSRAAAAIENARLYEDLQATFQQTIHGLAKAIDKMDRYTAGHSDRVAQYAVYLAQRLGLGAHEIEIVRQSALMHDIGKIGCVLNLNKPGKLTTDEYEVFKKHPVYGRDILDPIKFLHPLIPGVYLHHERWDGRGYPLKMKGNEIPIIARIISVADTYDAMTSNRSYRRALPHEVAVAEIERCASSQFDPDVSRIFVEGLDVYREECATRGDRVPE
jgi:response regulator RpfG family c-di-GMP phosphodiesterase